MRLTAKQRELLAYFHEQGKEARGRWVSRIPKDKVRTFNSLRDRGLLEEKSIPLPRSKWPEKGRRKGITVGYGYLVFRIPKDQLKSVLRILAV